MLPQRSHINRGHSDLTTSSLTQQSSEHDEGDMTPTPTLPYPLTALSLEMAQQIHEEFLICKICLDSFNKPKSLTCLHTFCQACIENHISAEVTYNKTTDYHHFTCPLCRKRTNLPIGGVRKLPDNFLVSGLSDMLSRTKWDPQLAEMDKNSSCRDSETAENESICAELSIHRQRKHGPVGLSDYGECEICSQFDDKRGRSSTPRTPKNVSAADLVNQRANSAVISTIAKASAKCLDCNKLLCVKCVTQHKAIRVTKDHAIFDLSTESAITCKDHPEEHVRFHCEACSICICVLCTFDNHREHEVRSFGEAILQLRTEINKGLNETQGVIQRTRKWLAVVDDAADGVHTTEREIREWADRAMDEIHQQEDKLIEQLHGRLGHSTMQIIQKAPEWECQLARLESLHAEVKKLIEGQDIDVLLAQPVLAEKMTKLSQLEMTGLPPMGSYQKSTFAHHEISLGQLIFPGDEIVDLSRNVTAPSASKFFLPRLSISTQTDERSFTIESNAIRPVTTEAAIEANILPSRKVVRHRAINTERTSCVDQEANTRPRGINVSITFGGDEQFNLLNNYLTAMRNGDEPGDDATFAGMDNLTRARLRRKLKERWSTIDNPITEASAIALSHNLHTGITNATQTAQNRRFSDNSAL